MKAKYAETVSIQLRFATAVTTIVTELLIIPLLEGFRMDVNLQAPHRPGQVVVDDVR